MTQSQPTFRTFFRSLALSLVLATPLAFAQQPGGPGPQGGPGAQGRQARDCTKAADPKACEAHRAARQQAAEACKGKAGPERRQCLQDQMQNADCSKARNPQQCRPASRPTESARARPARPSSNASSRRCLRPTAARPPIRRTASATRRRAQRAATRSDPNTGPACGTFSRRRSKSRGRARRRRVPPH